MESAVFMGKNFQNSHNSIVNTADLTLKQMFDLSAESMAEEDEISGLETIGWENIHGNTCHSMGDKMFTGRRFLFRPPSTMFFSCCV